LIKDRGIDESRNDSTFKPLYMNDKRRRKFVTVENAMPLNQRLVLQQGIFTCPGDIGSKFVANLKAMPDWNLKQNIIKLQLGGFNYPAHN
jgi:hypothetical protein